MVGESAAPTFYAQNKATSHFLEDFDMGPLAGYLYVLFDSEGEDCGEIVERRLAASFLKEKVRGSSSPKWEKVANRLLDGSGRYASFTWRRLRASSVS
ncbi:hypothetical protein LWI29_011276 [Acer saccharum]|uniref:Uncharacterized protein n=1 Tax=Acer saccharum TaxID=4024 RepID=A0AA39RLD7_ACESA|nr:hypothetical protein LWI29_011276 [Acer saccharum]